MPQKNQTDLISHLKQVEEKSCPKKHETEFDKAIKLNLKKLSLLAELYKEKE